MSKEKDPHRRERAMAQYLGGCRVPLRHRPSKYSRWVDHPWMEVSKLTDKAIHQKLLGLFGREWARIRIDGKLHIALIDAPATPSAKMMVVIPAGEFMAWFGGGCDYREHAEKLERERLEREAGPTYDEEELFEWVFNR